MKGILIGASKSKSASKLHMKVFRGGMSLAFFLIVPSVMIVSVVAVHALANRLGLRIYYTTLAATAVLSFMVNVAAATMTPYVGREFLLRLGLLILAASFLLTLANRFLLKQQRAEEKNFHEEVKAAYEAEKESPLIAETPDKFDWNEDAPPTKYNESVDSSADKKVTMTDADESDKEFNVAEKVAETVKADTATPKVAEPVKADTATSKVAEPVKADTATPKVVESVKADTATSKVVESVKAEVATPNVAETVKADTATSKVAETVKADAATPKVAVSKPQKEFPLEKVFEPLAEVKPEELEKLNDAEFKPEPEKEFPLEEVFQPLSEVKAEEVEIPKEPPKPEDNVPLQEVFKPLSTIKLEKLDELPVEEVAPSEEAEEPDTLDDILDKAYNERAKGHVWQAIELYKKAMERYRNDEYAPFVAIDLGNIYKEQALYSKAIKIFEEALELPAVTHNEDIKKEFTTNLEYLRVVRDVLLKYHASSVPFGKLTKPILREIDAEFQKAQRHSEQFK